MGGGGGGGSGGRGPPSNYKPQKHPMPKATNMCSELIEPHRAHSRSIGKFTRQFKISSPVYLC